MSTPPDEVETTPTDDSTGRSADALGAAAARPEATRPDGPKTPTTSPASATPPPPGAASVPPKPGATHASTPPSSAAGAGGAHGGARPSSAAPSRDEDDDDEDEEDEDDVRGRRYGFGRGDERKERRSGFEGLFRDSLRKAVERGLEVGMGTLKTADNVVRNVTDEVKLPKEISNYLFSQIDETKNVLIKAVAGEVREFLAATDLSSELQRALTALSFEVRMEIRFIPNDKGELKPKVKAKAVPRARRRRDDDDEDAT